MGFFKDLNTLKHQGKELSKNSDPGAQMRDAKAKMAALNATMVQSTTALTADPGDAIVGQVQFVSVAPTKGSVNGSAVVQVSVLLLAPGRPPIPVETSLAVPAMHLWRAQPGSTLPAHLSAADPTAFAVDWAAPGAPAGPA